MIQTTEVVKSVRLHMKVPARFSTHDLTSRQLAQAVERYSKGTHSPADGYVANGLVRSIKLAGARVIGSPIRKLRYRQEIFGMVAYYNLPALFVTINLSDLHDPKVLSKELSSYLSLLQLCVMAGKDVDLESFLAENIPEYMERATTVADDPIAVAEWFTKVMRAVSSYYFYCFAHYLL